MRYRFNSKIEVVENEGVGNVSKREFSYQDWKFNFENEGNKMKSILVRLGLAALMVGALAACGSGSTGAAGPAGAPGTNGTNTVATVNGKTLAAADWQALAPTIDPASISVTIAPVSGAVGSGAPVVKFKVTDQNGDPVVGLGGQYPAVGTAVTHTNYNLNFTLAKLVPGTSGNPSKWVNLLVDKPVAPSTVGAVPNGNYSWLAAYPTAEAQGTLVDNGDGTYQYTFLRDVKQTQAIVNAVGQGAYENATNHVADLDPANLNFDPTATHRLGIFIQGSQPGTGINTPTATAQTTPVPLLKTFNIGYDFRPDGGTTTATRDIVMASSCDGCHGNVKLKRGIGHISTAGTSNLAVSYSGTVATNVTMSNGIPPGTYVGRNDPRLCVTCHTDQAKYTFPVVTGDGTNNYGNSAYYRVAVGVLSDNQAAFIYPRMIHQTHMGNQLVKTGYNLNGHDANCASVTVAKDVAAAQCLNLVGLPQDQRNCTKCHDGSATKSDGSVNANQTKDGDNWKNVPSQLACGACHDGINFATGTGTTLADNYADIAAGNPAGTTQSGHQGGSQADNSYCTVCHRTGGLVDIQVAHETNFATLNNPVAKTGVDTVAYSIKSVTVNASGQPVITFQIKINGTAVRSLPVHTPVTNGVSGAIVTNTYAQPITGLTGGPSFYAAYAVPQDGISTPSDYNARYNVSLASLLIDTTGGTALTSPAAGYLTNTVSSSAFLADSNGYFTAALTGDTIGQPVTATCKQNTGSSAMTGNCVNPSPIIIPANAAMVTGAMIGGFTQINLTAYPYTPGDLTTSPATAAKGTGLHVTAVLQKLVASTCSQPGATSACKTARRVVVSAANCNNCHEQLGTNQFMENGPLTVSAGTANMRLGFHNSDRNDPTACNLCHNGDGADSSGFPYDSSTWYHGIHGASQRTVPFVVEGKSAEDFSTLLFPGQLKDCSQCHLSDTANFGIAEATGQLANKLWSYTATGTVVAPTDSSSTVINVITGVKGAAGAYVAPAVPAGSLVAATAGGYGNAFSYTAASAVAASYTACGGATALPCTTTTVPAQVAPAGGLTIKADPLTLVNSPFASACSSCHDDVVSQSHIKANGGFIQATRGTAAALVNTEQCVTCHGQGRTMDAVVIHQQR